MAGRGTPATALLAKQRITHTVHAYEHDPRQAGYGQEASDALGVAPERVFKTLVAQVDGALTVGVVPVGSRHIGLDKQQIPHSSVLTRTAQQIGGSFGIAVLAVILEGAIAAHPATLADAFHVAFWWSAGFSAVAVVLSLWLPGAQRHPKPAAVVPLASAPIPSGAYLAAGKSPGNPRLPANLDSSG